ncbi:hypothetical protein Pla123a_23240 [Posidoniimonas polymericola]|uniref:Uncharacterized protein n=2 Tax=Posidoniimonas polymericola TaxID=2528002 RepID=A0A5C5YQ60_9BACT|nr:hypothetical protein Pla123a_23240 [Posidoniimonas polymericola]
MVTQASDSWNPMEVAPLGGVAPEMNPLATAVVSFSEVTGPADAPQQGDRWQSLGDRWGSAAPGEVCSSDPFDDFEDDDFDDEFDDDFEEEWDDDLGDSEYADEFPPDEEEESDDEGSFNDDPDFDDE